MRLKDYNIFTGVNWEGVDNDIIGFRNELYDLFPDKVKVTSAKRYGKQCWESQEIKADIIKVEHFWFRVLSRYSRNFFCKEGDALLIRT